MRVALCGKLFEGSDGCGCGYIWSGSKSIKAAHTEVDPLEVINPANALQMLREQDDDPWMKEA
jgi:hypothetical protein